MLPSAICCSQPSTAPSIRVIVSDLLSLCGRLVRTGVAENVDQYQMKRIGAPMS